MTWGNAFNNSYATLPDNGMAFASGSVENQLWCPRPDSNQHIFWIPDFESGASTNSATGAAFGRQNRSGERCPGDRPCETSKDLRTGLVLGRHNSQVY